MPKAISDLSSPQPEVRGMETGQFEVSDSESMSAEILKERKRIKEELGKFSAMHLDEKTEDLTGHNLALPEETQESPHLKMSRIIEERARKRDIESMRAQLQASLMKSRSNNMKMDKAIMAKERHLKNLKKVLGVENHVNEHFFKRHEKKSVDARALFEKESKSKQERSTAIEKLTEENGTTESELATIDETLNGLKSYKDILWKLSPSFQWQKALKAEEESAVRVTNPQLDSDSSEEKLELYFSDPQEVLDLRTELTEQDLSLIQYSSRGEEMLEELRQTTETTLKKLSEDDEKLTLQVNNMTDRIDTEKERAGQLKKMVQLHDLLKTEDQDILLAALAAKVTEVHGSDQRLMLLSTLEKLSSIEYRVSLLLEHIDSIPEENLETLRQIKDSERRSRLREEELRLERERQKEKMKKCTQRSLGESKKKSGRKLMPRCIPVEQKIKVNDEDNIPAEDDLYAYLFTTEDVE